MKNERTREMNETRIPELAEAPSERPIAEAAPAHLSLTDAELVQLQVRVIALENLVTALLVGAPEGIAELAQAMAVAISPRPGATPHRLTIHAASQMVHLVQRSHQFRDKTPE